MVAPNSPPRTNYVNSSEDFDKWIRMATDNKINVSNSWDLALIDYFYDLSLLRDGDGINFQKASATLDGCVKIYSSRVDSAVTETGRLISGLATRRSNESTEDQESGDEDEDEINDLDGQSSAKGKKNRAATNKCTLVDFKALMIKKMDLELYVDPLFKKALAEFDEGGSKSLLLNMLHVNEDQKVVFDTTDSAQLSRDSTDGTLSHYETDEGIAEVEHSFAEMDIDEPEELSSESNINHNLIKLGQRYLSDVFTSSVNVCPSLNELRSVIDQNGSSTALLQDLENIEVPDPSQQIPINSTGYETTYNDLDVSLGEIGGHQEYDDDELQENNSKYPGNKTSIFFNDYEDEADDYGITMRMLFDENKSYHNPNTVLEEGQEDILDGIGSVTTIPDDDLLAYFDENQGRNWAGPEHWKITKIKKVYNFSPINHPGPDQTSNGTQEQPKKRNMKEKLVIDFLSENNYPDEEAIFQPGGQSINLPKHQWISKTKNVLPDDRNFSTRHFITLFTKPKLINSRFNKVKDLDNAIDESLYAENTTNPIQQQNIPILNNADFFNDDDGGHNEVGDVEDLDDHNDDLYDEEVGPSQLPSSQLLSKSQGSQNPLSYSRVSKKVDIHLLKDNIWDTIRKERSSRLSIIPEVSEPESSDNQINDKVNQTETTNLKFSEVVTGLNSKYDKEKKKDLSTSFCFICLLHLANENGFTITNNEDNTDLMIQNFVQ